MSLKFGSVCSGIEAASVAWSPLGWKAAWFAEIEPFPSAVLAHHYPETPNLGDMTKIARAVLAGEVEAPDILCGGTPCQAFSVAGLRESLADARGNLTLKFVELADAIDHVRVRAGNDPAIVFWENVPGVLSTKDNAFGCFLAGLAGEDEPLQPPGERWSNAGAVYGPTRAIAWRTLDAQYFGLAQRRRRVFVVASARNGFDPAQVLFEWDGVRRDIAPSREARQVAPTIPSRSTPGGGLGTDFDLDGGVIHAPPVSPALKARDHKGPSSDGDGDGDGAPLIAHSLRGEGFDASEDGTGRGTPLVPVSVALRGREGGATIEMGDDLAFALRASSGGGDKPHVLAFDTTQITSQANRSNPKPGDPCHPLAAGAHAPAIAFSAQDNGRDASSEICTTIRKGGTGGGVQPAVAYPVGADMYNGALTGDVAATLGTQSGDGVSSGPSVMQAMQVRRLTPEECEALQGFPRGYTAIPWRKKTAAECPDGPRYKALGNSWAVPNVRWIGQRLQQVEAIRQEQRAAA